MSKLNHKFEGTHWSKMPNADEIRLRISATKKLYPTRYWLGKKSTKEMIEKMSLTKRKNSTRQFHQQVRSSIKYLNWRKSIYERDNFKCVVCFQGGYLNADHIKPFSLLIKEFIKLFPELNREELFTRAMEWKPFWDMANGRTLCIDCHRKTDTYGSGVYNITHT